MKKPSKTVTLIAAGLMALGCVGASSSWAAKSKRVKVAYSKRPVVVKAYTPRPAAVARPAATKRVLVMQSKSRVAVTAQPRPRMVLAKVEPQPELAANGDPILHSAAVVVADQSSGEVLFEKNSDAVLPIASITKLMTAIVVLDAAQDLREQLVVRDDDVDVLRGSRSRLAVGVDLSREDMLRLALMSSENRAAHALGRHYPGGLRAFVAAMNRKSAELELRDTHFSDPTGLSASNVSSARDLVKMVVAASKYPLIREFSTTAEYAVVINGRPREFHNTNALVRNPGWEIGVSKTGFINEAGKCLVMQAWMANRPMIIVLLDSWGKLTRIGDANRIKRWVEAVGLNARRSG